MRVEAPALLDMHGEPVDPDALAWDKQGGLLPAVVQDASTLRVLMLAYMDRHALAATLAGGLATFFSRSRQASWTKGERSGHVLRVRGLRADCDADTLLVLAEPTGPTCHTGAPSCFGKAPFDALAQLQRTIDTRAAAEAHASYTRRLLDAGLPRVAQKVGEEGVETALAAVTADDAALCGEAADLLYHLLVLLRARGLGWEDVTAVLGDRARQTAV